MAAAVEDHGRMPEPLREEPPKDRWCDLVMTGGVASGVVYPWAVVELARHFRLRNIGGTSVGAMAAAIAAACEYGRRQGNPQAYEVMRRLPVELAAPVESKAGGPPRPRMLTLFQPSGPGGWRLLDLALALTNRYYGNERFLHADPGAVLDRGQAAAPAAKPSVWRGCKAPLPTVWRLWGEHARAPLRWACITAATASALCFLLLLAAQLLGWPPHSQGWAVAALEAAWCASALLLIWALVRVLREIWNDVQVGLVGNDLGLCCGSFVKGEDRNLSPKDQALVGLVDWTHEGIQRAAGLPADGPPLTFEDLWNAPLWPGGPRPRSGPGLGPSERSINLEMVTTNVTHGRPYRLPLADATARLFFDPKVWQRFFPPPVMAALLRDTLTYQPRSAADPPTAWLPEHLQRLRELPSGKLPIVVASRLSLSYPLLFATVPLWAIDYEEPCSLRRVLRPCRFSDGGLCSNFPIHFFDAALPRWPTFGLWLQDRSPSHPDQPVWLPSYQGQGWGDSWQRFEPAARVEPAAPGRATAQGLPRSEKGERPSLAGFLWAALMSAKNWKDLTDMRMPQVRRRVARLGLRHGEGELNIGMPGSLILYMAQTYGTTAGRLLCQAYAPAEGGPEPTPAWREHLMVRLQVLMDGLQGLLKDFGAAATSQGHTLDLQALLALAQRQPAIDSESDRRCISAPQAQELLALAQQLTALEATLAARQKLPQAQQPVPELGLRPRL